jgi:hypothetical protein
VLADLDRMFGPAPMLEWGRFTYTYLVSSHSSRQCCSEGGSLILT